MWALLERAWPEAKEKKIPTRPAGRETVGLGGKGEKNSEQSQRRHETCIFLLKNIDLKFIHRFKVCLFERKYLFSRFDIRLNIDLSFVFSRRSSTADLR